MTVCTLIKGTSPAAFAVIAFGEIVAETQQESKEPHLPEAPPMPSPEQLATPIPTTSPTQTDEKPGAEPTTLTLDDVGAAFWLKRQDDGMYDAVADLNWIAIVLTQTSGTR